MKIKTTSLNWLAGAGIGIALVGLPNLLPNSITWKPIIAYLAPAVALYIDNIVREFVDSKDFDRKLANIDASIESFKRQMEKLDLNDNSRREYERAIESFHTKKIILIQSKVS